MSNCKVLIKLRNQQGYSLIEIMIVVAIIGILAFYAKFSYSPANARLKQATRELYSNMQSARMQAIKRNEDWGIICDNATNTYALCALSAGLCVGDNTTIDLSSYGSGVQFGYGDATKNTTTAGGACPDNCPSDGVSYNGNSAYFNNKGMSPKMGYIYLENNRDTTFVVGNSSLAGVVKIRKWSGTSNAWE